MRTWQEAIDYLKESYPGCEVCEIHLMPIQKKYCWMCCPPGLCYTCGKSFLTFSPRNQCDDCLWPDGFPLSVKWFRNLFTK